MRGAMSRDDFDTIDSFLSAVGHRTLFSYLGVQPTDAIEVVLHAIDERRQWATERAKMQTTITRLERRVATWRA